MKEPEGTPAAGPPPEDATASRWGLIRDLLVFSVKAGLEALRDLVLIPLALVAGLVGVLLQRDDPAALFRQVVEGGRRFDRWLDLFGEHAADGEGPHGVDAILSRVESAVVEEYRRGGVTQQAKTAIDRTLDRIQRGPGRDGTP